MKNIKNISILCRLIFGAVIWFGIEWPTGYRDGRGQGEWGRLLVEAGRVMANIGRGNKLNFEPKPCLTTATHGFLRRRKNMVPRIGICRVLPLRSLLAWRFNTTLKQHGLRITKFRNRRYRLQFYSSWSPGLYDFNNLILLFFQPHIKYIRCIHFRLHATAQDVHVSHAHADENRIAGSLWTFLKLTVHICCV